MEKWQKDHIAKNLVELIKCTSCNVELISFLTSAGILGESDVEQLENPILTRMEKSKTLYGILPSRIDSFDVLIKSLQETKQSGAATILKNHDVRHCKYGRISFDENHVLGEGCFGTIVYKGTFGGREVAVKVVSKKRREVDTLHKEIDFLQKLDSHENIIRFFTAEVHDNFIYIVLERCLINLQDEMKMNLLNMKPSDILLKCTKGVAYLHKHNVIHSDLKPANVLLNNDDQVKISDFGISKEMPIGATSITISGIAGTAEWMAPEFFQMAQQNESSIKMTKATDIFSLGCIFYFVLTKGSHPFGDTAVDRQYNISHFKPQIDLSVNDSVDKQWIPVIKKMISQTPNERPTAELILENHCSHKETIYRTEKKSTMNSVYQLPQQKNIGEMYRAEIPGVVEFLENDTESERILIVETFDLDICISRIKDTLGIELPIPIQLITVTDEAVLTFSTSGRYLIKLNFISLKQLDILRNTNAKILVITLDAEQLDNTEIRKVEDQLSWVDLTTSYQKKLANCLDSYGSTISMESDARKDYYNSHSHSLTLVAKHMCDKPGLYSNFTNFLLTCLINERVNNAVVATLVTHYLDDKIAIFSSDAIISVNDAMFGLASISVDVKKHQSIREAVVGCIIPNFDEIVQIQMNVDFLTGNGILDNLNQFKSRIFEMYFVANILNKIYKISEQADTCFSILLHVHDYSTYNNGMIFFLNAIEFDKQSLHYLVSYARGQNEFFEVCIEKGCYNLLRQIMKYDQSIFHNVDGLIRCRLPTEGWFILKSFMAIYTDYKHKIQITVEKRVLESFPSKYVNHCKSFLLYAVIPQNNFALFKILLEKYDYLKNLNEYEVALLRHICVSYTSPPVQEVIISNRLNMLQAIDNLNFMQETTEKLNLSPLSAPCIHLSIIKVLLKSGFSAVNIDENESTIAHLAGLYLSDDMYYDLVLTLVEGGLQKLLNTVNIKSEIPIFSIMNSRMTQKTFEAVLELSGNDVNCKGHKSQSLLHVIAVKGNLELAQLVIDKDVEVNATDDFGDTPLHYVVREENSNTLQMILLLLKVNADVNVANQKGETPISLAEANYSRRDKLDMQAKDNMYYALKTTSLKQLKALGPGNK